MNNSNSQDILASVTDWLSRVVVGLNLCPFAANPLRSKRVRIQLSNAHTEEALLTELQAELSLLDTTPAAELETILLVLPCFLTDFSHYNQFLDLADELLQTFGWEGCYQIASFHPRYQFAGTAAEDVENLTNRAPYPIFHLLREASLEQIIDSHPDTGQIPEINIQKINALTVQQRQQYFPYLFNKDDV